jgi:hypothetical protein
MTPEELETMKSDIEVHELHFKDAGDRLSEAAKIYEFLDRALGRAKREYEAALAEQREETK